MSIKIVFVLSSIYLNNPIFSLTLLMLLMTTRRMVEVEVVRSIVFVRCPKSFIIIYNWFKYNNLYKLPMAETLVNTILQSRGMNSTFDIFGLNYFKRERVKKK